MTTVEEIVNVTPLLERVPTVTVTFPVLAPDGTLALMLVFVQFVTEAWREPNFTVPEPPKFAPVMVTGVPTGPATGDRLEIEGVGTKVKFRPLLATPPTVTTTFPEEALAGTATAMLESLQLDATAATPLNVTALCHWLTPKWLPAIVIVLPAEPELGLRLLRLGGSD